jgi:hypothetical protein
MVRRHVGSLLTGRVGKDFHICAVKLPKAWKSSVLNRNARIAKRICNPRLEGQFSNADLAAKVQIVA